MLLEVAQPALQAGSANIPNNLSRALRTMGNSKQPRALLLSQYRRGKYVYWVKKLQGKRLYFERVDKDPTGEISLQLWIERKNSLSPASRPVKPTGKVTIIDLCNHWMAHHESKLNSGELTKRSFEEYFATCKILIDVLGKSFQASELRPGDFAQVRAAIAERFNVLGLKKRIIQIRSLFSFAVDEGVLRDKPQFGRSFQTPSAKSLRLHRAEKGPQDFTREEILAMLEKPTVIQKAMVLLGINGGLGNSDIADLPITAVDLENGWLNYARAKTGVERRIPLWDETIAAINRVLDQRPDSETDKLFVSLRGQDYTDEARTGQRVTGEFRQVLNRAKIKANGRGFYGLRRSFQTQAEVCLDIVAVKSIMGHTIAENDMSGRYRQRVTDERLLNATSAVRTWLYGEAS